MSQVQSSKSQAKRSVQLVVESLEHRCMLSASHVSLSHGSLVVTGTSKADHVSIMPDAHHKTLVDVKFNGKMFTFAKTRVHKISVDGKQGDDIITVAPAISTPATLLGRAGDDSLTGGGGKDQINGGTGNDTCEFRHNSGIAFANAPAAVQTGLTTLAQGATITNVQLFRDNGQTFYGTIVTISGVNTRIVVDSHGNPVSFKSHDNGSGGNGQHEDDHRTFGTIASVDVNGASITVNVLSEHAAPRQTTFAVDPEANITVNGSPTNLGSLTAGEWVSITKSPTDSTTLIAIKVFGKDVEGVVNNVDSNASTITITREHHPAQTFAVDANADITLNGDPAALINITTGLQVHLQFTPDNTTVVLIDAHQNGHEGGGDHGGPDF